MQLNMPTKVLDSRLHSGSRLPTGEPINYLYQDLTERIALVRNVTELPINVNWQSLLTIFDRQSRAVPASVSHLSLSSDVDVAGLTEPSIDEKMVLFMRRTAPTSSARLLIQSRRCSMRRCAAL